MSSCSDLKLPYIARTQDYMSIVKKGIQKNITRKEKTPSHAAKIPLWQAQVESKTNTDLDFIAPPICREHYLNASDDFLLC